MERIEIIKFNGNPGQLRNPFLGCKFTTEPEDARISFPGGFNINSFQITSGFHIEITRQDMELVVLSQRLESFQH